MERRRARRTDAPLLGGSVSSCTLSLTSDQQSVTLWVGATAGDTSYDCLSYSFTAAVDTSRCTGPEPAGGWFMPPSQAVTSNGASNIGMTFQAPTDENGNPIMTANNPESPAPGASDTAPDGSELPPNAVLTEVDFAYPTNAPASMPPPTLTVDPSVLEFWDSDSEGNLIVGGLTRGITFGQGAPTTMYAELSQGLTNVVGGGWPAVVAGVATFACNGASQTVTPAGVSLSMDGDAPGDPDATVPIDTSATTSPTYAPVNLTFQRPCRMAQR